MDNQTKWGVFYALFAYIFWGLVPLYFKLVSEVASLQVLAHRVIWSLLFLMFVLAFKKEFKNLFFILKNKKISLTLFVTSFIISINWLTYIWAIEHDRILDTSLGYYINPLVTIFFGIIFFKENPSRNQKIAIFIAFIAIVFTFYTLKTFSFVTFILAVTFPIYGLIRKKINISSLVGLFIETMFLFPFAIIFLMYDNATHYVFTDRFDLLMLLSLSGIITVIPLLAFNSAAIRLKLSTLGFFQYIGPTSSMCLAIFVFKEEFRIEKLITFVLIWIALFISALDSFKKTSPK